MTRLKAMWEFDRAAGGTLISDELVQFIEEMSDQDLAIIARGGDSVSGKAADVCEQFNTSVYWLVAAVDARIIDRFLEENPGG